MIPRKWFLEFTVNGCRNFNSVPVVWIVVFKEQASVRKFAEISHLMSSFFIFWIKHFDELLYFCNDNILRVLLFLKVDNFTNIRFVLFNEFFIVFAESLVLNVYELLKLLNGVKFLARPRESLKNLFEALFRMIKKLECLYELKVNV